LQERKEIEKEKEREVKR
jgi:hypothetical protein